MEECSSGLCKQEIIRLNKDDLLCWGGGFQPITSKDAAEESNNDANSIFRLQKYLRVTDLSVGIILSCDHLDTGHVLPHHCVLLEQHVKSAPSSVENSFDHQLSTIGAEISFVATS